MIKMESLVLIEYKGFFYSIDRKFSIPKFSTWIRWIAPQQIPQY